MIRGHSTHKGVRGNGKGVILEVKTTSNKGNGKLKECIEAKAASKRCQQNIRQEREKGESE